jgi:hypothetical protein
LAADPLAYAQSMGQFSYGDRIQRLEGTGAIGPGSMYQQTGIPRSYTGAFYDWAMNEERESFRTGRFPPSNLPESFRNSLGNNSTVAWPYPPGPFGSGGGPRPQPGPGTMSPSWGYQPTRVPKYQGTGISYNQPIFRRTV